MQEAFRNAARKDPQNPIARDIFDSSDRVRWENQQRAQARERIQLNGEFQQIGKDWLTVKTNRLSAHYRHLDEDKVKQKWQKSVNKLRRFPDAEQREMLNQFCNGMGLSEDRPNPAYYGIVETLYGTWEIVDRLRRLMGERKTDLSPISRMFLEVFKDISAYSDETKVSLDDFINTKANLPSGRIFLPETLSAVTLWLKSPQPS